MLIKRADYKAVKHMDREALSAYLHRIYSRGYEAGIKATASLAEKATKVQMGRESSETSAVKPENLEGC